MSNFFDGCLTPEEAKEWIGKEVIGFDYCQNETKGELIEVDARYLTPFRVLYEEDKSAMFQFAKPAPQPELVPWTAEDYDGRPLVPKCNPSLERWVCVGWSSLGVHLGHSSFLTFKYFEDLLDQFTQLDGSPCGKEVVE